MGGYERPMLRCYDVITSVRACVFLYILRTRIILVSCITLAAKDGCERKALQDDA